MLHLEALAAHKGSVLWHIPPDEPQPTQRTFESRLYTALAAFDPQQPVFVEAESRRIGLRQLPDELLSALRHAPGIRIEASTVLPVLIFCCATTTIFWPTLPGYANVWATCAACKPTTPWTCWNRLIEARDFSTLVAEL